MSHMKLLQLSFQILANNSHIFHINTLHNFCSPHYFLILSSNTSRIFHVLLRFYSFSLKNAQVGSTWASVASLYISALLFSFGGVQSGIVRVQRYIGKSLCHYMCDSHINRVTYDERWMSVHFSLPVRAEMRHVIVLLLQQNIQIIREQFFSVVPYLFRIPAPDWSGAIKHCKVQFVLPRQRVNDRMRVAFVFSQQVVLKVHTAFSMVLMRISRE